MWCDLGFVPNSRGNKAASKKKKKKKNEPQKKQKKEQVENEKFQKHDSETTYAAVGLAVTVTVAMIGPSRSARTSRARISVVRDGSGPTCPSRCTQTNHGHGRGRGQGLPASAADALWAWAGGEGRPGPAGREAAGPGAWGRCVCMAVGVRGGRGQQKGRSLRRAAAAAEAAAAADAAPSGGGRVGGLRLREGRNGPRVGAEAAGARAVTGRRTRPTAIGRRTAGHRPAARRRFGRRAAGAASRPAGRPGGWCAALTCRRRPRSSATARPTRDYIKLYNAVFV